MNRPATTAACPASASRCPNAQACSPWGQYGPDCEDGVVMPKCFVSIHLELGVLQFLAKATAAPDALEQALRHIREGRTPPGLPHGS